MIRFLLLASLVLLSGWPAAAQSVINNVRSAQVPGTHKVRITYDVTAGSICTTALEVSEDGGATYGSLVPVEAIVSGSHLGPGIFGNNRIIELHASKVPGLAKVFTKQVRFKVTAANVTTLGDMVLIPAGIFQMGDALDGISWAPVRSVYVSAYFMGRHEVTKELWDEVRTWGVNNGYSDLPVGNGSYISKGPNHPVHSITWFDMVKWCNALSQKVGLTPCYNVSGAVYKIGGSAPDCNWDANGYRLPTQAEWEKAARGGLNRKRFPWGDTISHSEANYFSVSSDNYDVSPTQGYHPTYAFGGRPYSSPVGSFAPNEYGLYDMAGNMLEWCWDWDGDESSSTMTLSDPRGPISGSSRESRGGGWAHYGWGARIVFVHQWTPTNSNYHVGFRIARKSAP